jgi:hypothetical protein
MDTDLARLVAVEQIQQLKVRYCATCDDGHDPDQMTQLFTEDSAWESTGLGRHEGLPAIHDLFASFRTAVTFSQHNVTNGAVVIDGDLATATWNFSGVLGMRGAAPRGVLTRYTDTCRRENGVWKFVEVRSVLRGDFDLPGFRPAA